METMELTNLGKWETVLGINFMKISFPSGIGAIIEQTNKGYNVQPTFNGIADFEILPDQDFTNINLDQVEEVLLVLAQ